MDNEFSGVNIALKKFSMIYNQNLNKHTISSNNGDYTEITKAGISDFVNAKYGEDEPKYVLDDMGELNYYRILQQHKTYKSYNVNHTIPSIIEKKNGQITRIQLGKAKAELAIPEDIVIILVDNSAYIYNDDKLYIELHGSKTENKYVVIDYYSESYSVMEGDKLILYGEFVETPESLKTFGSDGIAGGDFNIEYEYEDGIISDIKVGTNNKYFDTSSDTGFFSYRADIMAEDTESVEKVIGIYPIPFIIKDDDIIEFNQDHHLYLTYILEYDEDGELELDCSYYCDLSLSEAMSVNEFWSNLIKAENSI